MYHENSLHFVIILRGDVIFKHQDIRQNGVPSWQCDTIVPMKRPLYSWVFPCYNEAQSLPQLVAQIARAMGGTRYEIIAVDDGSRDTTGKVLRSLATRTPPLHIITLPTRQGKWFALGAGIAYARANRVITLDSDLQDDPGEVKKLLKRLDDGYDVVSGWRKRRRDAWYKVWISQIGNRAIFLLTAKRWYDLNAPLKVYRREVLAAIPTHGALLRFSLLFANKLGFSTKEVPITHRPRKFGRSKFGVLKYMRILFDLVLVLLLFTGSGRIQKHMSESDLK